MPEVRLRKSAHGYWLAPGRYPFNSRSVLEPGEVRPSAAITGVSNINDLVLYEGDFTTSYTNQNIRDLHITGRIKIRHDGCRFDNVLAEGGQPSGSSYGTVEAFQQRITQTEFWDCTFRSSVLSVLATNAVQGRDLKMRRCDLSGTVDGLGAQYSRVEAYGCWFHGFKWYASDPAQSGGASHNDGSQIHGGTSFTYIGNAFEMGQFDSPGIHNSAMMIKQNVAPIQDLLVDQNWVYSIGAARTQVGLNVTQAGNGGGGLPYSGLVQITRNRFSDLSTFAANHAALIDSGIYDAALAAGTLAGNVYDSSNLPAKITRVAV